MVRFLSIVNVTVLLFDDAKIQNKTDIASYFCSFFLHVKSKNHNTLIIRRMNAKIKSLDEKKDDVLLRLPVEMDCSEQDEELLRRIAKDGFIKLPQYKGEAYTATLDGEEFIRKGGYQGHQKRTVIKAGIATVIAIVGALAGLAALFC